MYNPILLCFRYIIIGMNVGFCIDDMPELYTSFLSDSIWSWVDTIVSSDGMTGEPGTNAGRVDFSNCKDLKYTFRSIVCEASCHPVTRSLCHLVTRSLGHSVTWSLSHRVAKRGYRNTAR